MKKKYNLKEHLVFEWYNEWEQLDYTKKWNWITGTLINIHFEAEHFGYNFQIVVLGLGFYVRYNTDKSLKLFKKWEREAKKTDWGKILSSQEEFNKATKNKK